MSGSSAPSVDSAQVCVCDAGSIDWGSYNRQRCSSTCGVVRATTTTTGQVQIAPLAERRGISYAGDGGNAWDVYDTELVRPMQQLKPFWVLDGLEPEVNERLTAPRRRPYHYACGDDIEDGLKNPIQLVFDSSAPTLPTFTSKVRKSLPGHVERKPVTWHFLGPSKNSMIVRKEGAQCVYGVADCRCGPVEEKES